MYKYRDYDVVMQQTSQRKPANDRSITTILQMLSHAERVVTPMECHKLALEENVAIDLQVRSGGLDTAIASCYV